MSTPVPAPVRTPVRTLVWISTRTRTRTRKRTRTRTRTRTRARTRTRTRIATGLALLAAAWASAASAQVAHARPYRFAANLVVPQSRTFGLHASKAVRITGVRAGVVIVEQAAITTLQIALQNPTGRRQEAELLVPVPQGAAVRGFAFQGTAADPTARLLPKDEAKATYRAIVAKIRDPALLEFAGLNLIRSSVFPVAARGTQTVRLTYEHVLPADGARVDYVLPRSESIRMNVPWQISVKIKSKQAVATVYSPTHPIETVRTGAGVVSARVAASARCEPGAFRLSYLRKTGPLSASLLAYPDSTEGGGYFLLLAGVPEAHAEDRASVRREVTLVIDRSGSMRGEKIAQVREAALQILAGLDAGEAFNLIAYNDSVDRFSDKPVEKTPRTFAAAQTFIQHLGVRGGTNIHAALFEALRQPPRKGFLPVVLFLTDGLPTVGETREAVIRKRAAEHNPHERRIFTFGVGCDVNSPLLEGLAMSARGHATFVLPEEDVEAKVGGVFERLCGPVLTKPKIRCADEDGTARVQDLLPAALPDLFSGDQLVLLGRYRGEAPLRFTLTGGYFGEQRTFRFAFPLANATTENAFVPRLWASRKIAQLVDAVRDLGIEPLGDASRASTHAYAHAAHHLSARPLLPAARPPADPRLEELTEEIVRLSTEFGVLTEYTAFLAREGTDLTRRGDVLAQAQQNFQARAMRTRGGMASVNQSVNMGRQRTQQTLNRRNAYLDEHLDRVSISAVQQVADRAFFRRGARWIDSRLVRERGRREPSRVIRFGSAAYEALLDRLAATNRQALLSLPGEVLLALDGESVLVSVAGEGFKKGRHKDPAR